MPGLPIPQDLPSGTTEIVLTVPSDPEWYAYLIGSLVYLTQVTVWDDTTSTITREQAVAQFDQAVSDAIQRRGCP